MPIVGEAYHSPGLPSFGQGFSDVFSRTHRLVPSLIAGIGAQSARNKYLSENGSDSVGLSDGGQIDQPGLETIGSTGTYVDDGSNTSSEKAADDNLGFINQLVGSLTGENQRILQELMASATKAQYDYSERMSSTAYQRAVKDMKAAGLNPAVIFANNGGAAAASTPQVGISQVATENQLLTFFSAASQLMNGTGNLLEAILGRKNLNVSDITSKSLNITKLLK